MEEVSKLKIRLCEELLYQKVESDLIAVSGT